MCLIALFLKNWFCFYLIALVTLLINLVSLLGFILDLNISDAVLTEKNIAVNIAELLQ